MSARPKTLGALASCLLLGACTVGPDYVRPSVSTPADFAEGGNWKPATPTDTVVRGPWWHLFEDPALDALEAQVEGGNASLAASRAQAAQAQAALDVARAARYPGVTVGASASRARTGGNVNGRAGTPSTGSDFNLPLQANWEVDLFGRVSRSVESARASAQASAGDLAALALSLQAALALDYFQLRAADEQLRIVEETVAALERSLKLTENRYRAGVAARADVVQAQTQLDTALGTRQDLGISRAQLAHAIAALVGKTPDRLGIAADPLATQPPRVPAVVPSQLLERRPDIAAAERRMAAANAQIGVAQAAFFPSLTLSAGVGLQSGSLASWLSLPSRYWALGPSVLQSVFDAGLRRAQTESAREAYRASVANYRQVVLTAFQDTEDNLAAQDLLEKEALHLDAAARNARESLSLVTNQYKAGTVSYLEVVTAQTIALNAERSAADVRARRYAASVLLIKAIGGSWTSAQAQ